MEVEDSMILPTAKSARESRRIAPEEAGRAAVANLDTSNLARERQAGEAGQQGPQGDDHQQSPPQQRSAAHSSQVQASGESHQGLQPGGGEGSIKFTLIEEMTRTKPLHRSYQMQKLRSGSEIT